jgi:hypothetical protein
MGDEFNLGEMSFNPHDVEDGVLDFNEDDPNIVDDFMQTEYGDEIDIDSPLKEKSPEQISGEIEDLFISLLDKGDVESILALTGETPFATDVVSEEFFRGFTGSYAQAMLFNPAVKWYAKLLKMLPEGKFSVEKNNLKLKISPQFFKKTIYPFMGDFKIGLRDVSPIVNLIYNIAESLKDKDVSDKMQMIIDSQKSHMSDEEGLNAGNLDFEENMLDVSSVNADLQVDDDDATGGTGVDFDNNPTINIRLQDLANKTIAQFFIENNITDSVDIVSKLSEEGFNRARINEIIGIVRYMILQDSLPRQIGNKGAGNTNFNFK